MSREFEVTEGMVMTAMMAARFSYEGSDEDGRAYAEAVKAAIAHPDFRAQLRAWAAEEMRGLVPEGATMSMHGTATAVYAWDSCRAETLANIERWANLEDAP